MSPYGNRSEPLKQRTKAFALRIIRMVRNLPGDPACREIGKQVLRSGMSVAANYRAACRARSAAEFRAKLGIVEEEADETVFWLELLVESETVPQAKLQPLMDEADELIAITVASIRTARKNHPTNP